MEQTILLYTGKLLSNLYSTVNGGGNGSSGYADLHESGETVAPARDDKLSAKKKIKD